jgi:hypothetical protein
MMLFVISLSAVLLLWHGGIAAAFTADELAVAHQNQLLFSVRMSINETARMIQHYSGVKGAYYEFGMGGSTHLACAFLPPSAKLYAMDSNEEWVQNVASDPCIQKRVAEGTASVSRVDIGPTGSWGSPVGGDKVKHMWKDYSSSIAAYKDQKIDLILVDGRFRISCALESALLFPEATILLHDFFEPGHHTNYVKLEEVVDLVERTDTLLSLRVKPSVSKDTILKMIEDHRMHSARL